MASTAGTIRWLLVFAAIIFFAVQLRMFVSQTDCSERITKALEREMKWAHMARELSANLTALQEETQSLREQLSVTMKYSDEPVGETKGNVEGDVVSLNEGTNKESQTLPSGEETSIPGLRPLPPRLKRLLKPSTKGSETEETKGLKALLPPGLREVLPRLRKKLNPAEAQTQQDQSLPGKSPGKSKSTVVQSTVSMESPVVAAVVVMACNRADYLERTLKSVLLHHNPVTGKFPLFISQDGDNKDVQEKAQAFPQFLYLQHIEAAPPKTERGGENLAYYRISEHYKWAFSQLFDVLDFPRVIILEDDMEIAPDFFNYFEAMADLLDTDESVLAISSWNDNGQTQFVQDPEMLYRSDFFPGLGWMLRKELWRELAPKWPKAYWDDWLRLKANRKGRQSIRPEICRNFNFGQHGSSGGQFFTEYLSTIRLNNKTVDWTSKDLSYLLDVNYPEIFSEALSKAKRERDVEEVAKREKLTEDVLIEYRDELDFRKIASLFGIFQEWKDGVPRTAYEGVVVFRFHGPHRVFLANQNSLKALVKQQAS